VINLPEALRVAIEELCKPYSFKDLERLSVNLSQRYRDREAVFLAEEGHRFAYLMTRFPATYAAISDVLIKIKSKYPDLLIESYLDAGAGPGTGIWAVNNFFYLKQAILLEKDKKFIEIGQALLKKADFPTSIDIAWESKDLKKSFDPIPQDMVLLSYVLNELPQQNWAHVLETLWSATKKIFILIEPGTHQGFERVLYAREKLLSLGAHLIAPCPQIGHCPLKNTSDWCHFSVRLPRSSEHRRLKGAELGYEDEKFCYLVFSKHFIAPCSSRILRTPQKKSGHVVFQLCTSDGIKNRIVSRKEKEIYSQSKKFEWGDEFIPK